MSEEKTSKNNKKKQDGNEITSPVKKILKEDSNLDKQINDDNKNSKKKEQSKEQKEVSKKQDKNNKENKINSQKAQNASSNDISKDANDDTNSKKAINQKNNVTKKSSRTNKLTTTNESKDESNQSKKENKTKTKEKIDNTKEKIDNTKERKKDEEKTSSKSINFFKLPLKLADSKLNDASENKKTTNQNKKMMKKGNKKQNKEKQKRFNGHFSVDILDILIIIVATSIVSCVVTGFILNYQYKKNMNLSNREVVLDKHVQEFLNTYSEVVDNFYEEVDSEGMINAAMKGMMAFLEDNYSIYLTGSDNESLENDLDGSYNGFGILIRGNIIEKVYKNSPASEAGLEVNDEIIEINGHQISMENYNELGQHIDSENENNIVVKRDGKELSFKVGVRDVNIPATTSNIIKSPDKKKNIGYISLSAFSRLAFDDFQESLNELEGKGIDSLIIDLRGNTGGYLDVATNIINLFLEKDKIIYSLENKGQVTTYNDETEIKRDYKIVVLVNKSTASASEILASALHDSYGATIVGKTTYGKGKVQTMKHYENSTVKYTSAKWLRPNGECIDGVGVVPDYEVDIEYDEKNVYDKQLDKAIELLSK